MTGVNLQPSPAQPAWETVYTANTSPQAWLMGRFTHSDRSLKVLVWVGDDPHRKSKALGH